MARISLQAFACLAVVLAAIAAAAATPVNSNVSTTSVTGNVTTKELVLFSPPRNFTSQVLRYPSNSLSSIHDSNVLGPQAVTIWSGILAGGWTYTAQVCGAFVAAGGPAGTGLCASAMVAVLLTSAFVLYENGNAKRSLDVDLLLYVHSDFAPTIGCGTGCQLEARSVHNTWTLFGNATAKGISHTLSFLQNGNIKGIRVVQHGTKVAPLDKRQDDLGFDINSEGDWTSTSWWEDGPEAAWDTFPVNEDQVSDFVGDYMVNNEAKEICFGLGDTNGVALGSVLILDDQHITFVPPNIEQVAHDCVNSIRVAA